MGTQVKSIILLFPDPHAEEPAAQQKIDQDLFSNVKVHQHKNLDPVPHPPLKEDKGYQGELTLDRLLTLKP